MLALIATCSLGCSITLDPTLDPRGERPPADCREFDELGAHYSICLTPLATHSAARAECEARGAVLASILSQEENDFLASTARELETHTNLWLGGTRTGEVWTWPDGSVFWRGARGGEAPDGAYANWKSGEPNDSSTVSDEPEECAAMTLFDTMWNDRACSLELSYYCKR